MGRTGKRQRAAVVCACAWWLIGCGVNRAPIAGLSGEGGVSAGDGGESGTVDGGGDGGESGTSGSGGTSSVDAALVDSGMLTDGGADAGGPIHPDSCNMFRPTGGTCPMGWTTVDGITCRRICTGVGGLSNCPEATLQCPAGFACEIECQGVNTCPGKFINCADGPCSLTCSGVSSCTAVTQMCGADRCSATCISVMFPGQAVTQVPGNTCASQTCQ
jgi:hypothetical protein